MRFSCDTKGIRASPAPSRFSRRPGNRVFDPLSWSETNCSVVTEREGQTLFPVSPATWKTRPMSRRNTADRSYSLLRAKEDRKKPASYNRAERPESVSIRDISRYTYCVLNVSNVDRTSGAR